MKKVYTFLVLGMFSMAYGSAPVNPQQDTAPPTQKMQTLTVASNPEKDQKASMVDDTKMYAVLDTSLVDVGLAMNAIGHMSVGLGSLVGSAKLKQTPYESEDKVTYQNISEYPFIVMQGKQNHLLAAKESLEKLNIPMVTFLDTMHLGPTGAAQVQATAKLSSKKLKILGLAFIGSASVFKKITNKFSVYKEPAPLSQNIDFGGMTSASNLSIAQVMVMKENK